VNYNMNIVLIHIGKPPLHINDCIEQLNIFNSVPIYVCLNKEFRGHIIPFKNVIQIDLESLDFSSEHTTFIYESGKHIVQAKQGKYFWRYTTERFFYLDEVIEQYALTDVIHIECDNLVYCDVTTLLPVFSQYDIGFVRDNELRGIGSFVYVRYCLGPFIKFIVTRKSWVNDMNLIGLYVCENNLQTLPIGTSHMVPEKYHNNVDKFRSVFDGAALGQYIGGVDPLNYKGCSRGFVNETCVFRADEFRPRWAFDEMLRRVPVLYDMTRINNLHIHCKDLVSFMSRPRWSFKGCDIISGEQFQGNSDAVVGTTLNPLTRLLCKNTIVLPEHGSIVRSGNVYFPGAEVIHVYTHLIPTFKVHILPNIKTKFVLVTHNSDDSPTTFDQALLNDPRLIKWYCQNKIFLHNKLESLPIGIANSQWPHGNIQLLLTQREKRVPKDIFLFLNFDCQTNKKRDFIMKCMKKLTVCMPKMSQEMYLEELSRSKFCICPPGNGPDCHRVWECLYLGVVPIVERSVTWSDFQDLPILQIESWDTLTIKNLEDVYISLYDKDFNMSKLSMNYYLSKINSNRPTRPSQTLP